MVRTCCAASYTHPLTRVTIHRMIHYADYNLHLPDLKSLCVCIVCVADNTYAGVGNGGNAASNAGGSSGSPTTSPGPSALYQAPVLPVVVVAVGPVAAGPPVVAAGATAAVPSAVVPVAVTAAIAPANNGGGGRPQEMCDNRADGCHNHKVLNCTSGLCGVCCAASKRDPRCNVTKHYNKNTHK